MVFTNLESRVLRSVLANVVTGENAHDSKPAMGGSSVLPCPRHLLPSGTRTTQVQYAIYGDERIAMQLAYWAGRSTANAGVLARLTRFVGTAILYGWQYYSGLFRFANGWHTPPNTANRYQPGYSRSSSSSSLSTLIFGREDKRRVAK